RGEKENAQHVGPPVSVCRSGDGASCSKTDTLRLKLPPTTFERVGLTAQVHDALGEFQGRAMDPILTARYGMMAAARRVEQSAQRVARRGTVADLPAETVELVAARDRHSASLVVWK